MPAHGIEDGRVYQSLGFFDTPPSLSATGGHLAYQASIAQPDSPAFVDFGLWHGTERPPFSFLSTDAFAPVVLAELADISPPRVNNSGGLVYNNRADGVYVFDGITHRVIARAGDPAPGFPAGTTFFRVGENGALGAAPGFNDTGIVAIGGITSDFQRGVWITDGNELRLVLRSSVSAPGIPGANLVGFPAFYDRGPIINNRNELMFAAIVEGPGISDQNDGVIYLETADGLELLVRENQIAPGTAGVRFKGGFVGAPTVDNIGEPAFNDLGTVVFPARLEDDRNGIWYKPHDGDLISLLLEGQAARIDMGVGQESVTITRIELAPQLYSDPSFRILNNSNELAVSLSFIDSAGQNRDAVAIVTVPESQVWIIAAWISAIVGSQKRRRVTRGRLHG
jgi:hypothetical protein